MEASISEIGQVAAIYVGLSVMLMALMSWLINLVVIGLQRPRRQGVVGEAAYLASRSSLGWQESQWRSLRYTLHIRPKVDVKPTLGLLDDALEMVNVSIDARYVFGVCTKDD